MQPGTAGFLCCTNSLTLYGTSHTIAWHALAMPFEARIISLLHFLQMFSRITDFLRLGNASRCMAYSRPKAKLRGGRCEYNACWRTRPFSSFNVVLTYYMSNRQLSSGLSREKWVYLIKCTKSSSVKASNKMRTVV